MSISTRLERSRDRGFEICAHVMLGLPGETHACMLATAREVARSGIDAVKIHNLYAVKNTPLADQVARGEVSLMDRAAYIATLVDFLELLPPSMVVERVSGDAPPDYFVGPAWCLDKPAVRLALEAELARRDSWQGKHWSPRARERIRMSAAEAYFNDRFVPAADALISVTDAGFVQGTTVAEQLRTFGGRLFRLQQHVDRLFRSLEIVEVATNMTRQQFVEVATELAARNHRLLAPGDDLGLGIFVTPGSYAPMAHEPCGRRDRGHAHVPPALRPVGRQVRAGRVAGHDRRGAGASSLLAQRIEVPQPHALLSGRPAGAIALSG